MPGIDSHVVWPIGGTLDPFVRAGGWVPRGALRVAKDLREMPVNFDLVVKSDTSIKEQIEFVLDYLHLEVAEVVEERTVWVAHYDGRILKPWREVKAPVPNEEHKPLAPGMAGTWGGSTMKELFDGFVWWQDMDLAARGIIIVDETGLPEKDSEGRRANASCDSPYWGGGASIEMAKRWFEEQFGVTFSEETREMTVYVIRRKDASAE
jgi:hypothetical protein